MPGDKLVPADEETGLLLVVGEQIVWMNNKPYEVTVKPATASAWKSPHVRPPGANTASLAASAHDGEHQHLLRAAKVLEQDRDRWKREAEQLQRDLDALRKKLPPEIVVEAERDEDTRPALPPRQKALPR